MSHGCATVALALLILTTEACHALERGAHDAALRSTEIESLINEKLSTGVKNIEWPKSYSVSYVFSLPYTSEVQPDPISYDVSFHKVSKDGKISLRMDSLNGANSILVKKGVQYEVHPRLREQYCAVMDSAEDQDLEALPDISGWELVGTLFFKGQDASLYQYEALFEDKKVQYKFYVSKDNVPLRLHALGNEYFGGAHYDEWVIDYTSYSPEPPEKHVFKVPDICDESSRKGQWSSVQWHHMLPRVQYRGGHSKYDQFLASIGGSRRHKSLEEYKMRSLVFEENHLKIQKHNAGQDRTFTMKLNKFADWTREEYLSLLPNHDRKRRDAVVNMDGDGDAYEIPYKPLAEKHSIPTAIDWRGTSMAGVVKDQANCGSCWAFGAVGTLESAWNKAHGDSKQFSEQQVMDCSWGFVPGNEEATAACNGGDAYAGIGHIIKSGGISLSSDYEYLGQSDYCREGSVDTVATFKGYSKIPQFDDEALMEAVYSRGAVAVSLDASQESFTFYSSGVYYDPNCMWKSDDLDHSMLLVGYGTDPQGGDYWLVKNSWSTHWGDNGYVKISRKNHGCGASTDALYAVV